MKERVSTSQAGCKRFLHREDEAEQRGRDRGRKRRMGGLGLHKLKDRLPPTAPEGLRVPGSLSAPGH